MLVIGYIVGSQAPQSINQKLAQVLVDQAPDAVTMQRIDIADLPLYDRYMDEEFPESMTEFKHQVDEVDGLLVVSPEHNQSFPAAVKNALDILTRGGSNQLKNLPLALAGASPGRFGTINGQSQLRQFLPLLGVRLMGTPLMAVHASDTFLQDQVDEQTTQRASKYMQALAEFIKAQKQHS